MTSSPTISNLTKAVAVANNHIAPKANTAHPKPAPELSDGLFIG